MKTPEEIAREVVNDNTAPGEWSPVLMSTVAGLATAAIEADRAQRAEHAEGPLIEAVAQALDERGAHDAARLVRDTDPADDLWNYLGPMLDEIEKDYTDMAKEMNQ